MRIRIVIAALIAAVTAVLTVSPAAVAGPRNTDHAARVFPAAPADARSAKAAAVSPSLTPVLAGTVVYFADPGDPWECASGYFCTGVWDYTIGRWKAYDVYECRRYQLSQWNDEGHYWNAQTGNPTTFFYDQAGNVIQQFTPDNEIHILKWDPVWSIRNC